MSETYNGWTNFETWLLALNLDNEQGLYNAVNDLVTDYLNETHHDRSTADYYDLGNIIKDWLEELSFNGECNIYKLCDSWTFRDWNEIDWIEIAKSRLEE